MKLLYTANIRLPTEKAHGVQIMKMCEAFADANVTVELVVPRRKNHITTDPFEYYAVKRNFKITYISSLYFPQLGRVGFWIESILFAEQVARIVWQMKPDIVYSRDPFTLLNLYFWKVKCVWETHTGEWNTLLRVCIKRFAKIIAISKGLADFYLSKGISAEKIIIAHDGVDLEQFTVSADFRTARKRLGISIHKKIVLYVGHLYGWKGVDTLLDASKLIDGNTQVVIIGGTDVEISVLLKKYPQVLFLGYRPYRELPINQKIADVLIVPNSATNMVSKLYTSPLKVFAHMASGVPIIASDLPSIREVLNENNAILVSPDDPTELAFAIVRVLENTVRAGMLGARAQMDVAPYSWSHRAKKILDFFTKD